ncbi:MAG: hypothetical protein WEB30_08615 [Cyclobacteriaceae bacterium]
MKTIKVLLLLVLTGPALFAQTLELGSDLFLSRPTEMMARNMNNAFGITLAASKHFKSPFSVGIELNIATYGHETSRQEYTFSDGSVTETDVNVGNGITNLFLTGKHFLRDGKNVNPYLSGKLGWSWFTTNLTIEDPTDEFSCHPLESEMLSRDNTYSFSGGAGVRLDFNTFFHKTESQRLFFDFSVHAIHGGIVKYMNVEMDPAQPMPDQDVMARFINTQTQVIHEHHVGYVYSNVLSMVEYRVGVIYRFEY